MKDGLTKDGLTDEQLIAGIKNSYLTSLRANYEHHQLLAKAMGDRGELQSAKRHALLANVYMALVGEISPDSDPELSN